MRDLLLTDLARAFEAVCLNEILEAERLLSLRRQLPGHSSDIADLYVVARGFGWSLAQTGAFVAYMHQRLAPPMGNRSGSAGC